MAKILGLGLIAVIMSTVAAQARELLPQSLVCDKQLSLRQAMKRQNADNLRLPRDCRFTQTLIRTERLSCENDICQVRLLPLAGDPVTVYTLRRYQP